MVEADRPRPEPTGRRGALVGGLWNVAQMVVPLVLTALLSVVLARVLGADELGVQSLIAYSESIMFGVLVGSLVGAALQTMSAAGGQGDRRLGRSLSAWQMRLQILNGLVSLAVLGAVATTSEYSLSWWLAGATTAVNSVGWAFAARIISHEGSWASVSVRRLVLQVASQIAGMLAVLAGAGIAGVFAANFVSAFVLTLLLHRRWRTMGAHRAAGRLPAGISRWPPRGLMRLWTQYALLALLTLVVGQRIEFLFLAHYSSPEQIAMYSVAFMVVNTAILVPRSAVIAVLPALAARSGEEDQERSLFHLDHAVRIMAILSIPLTATLIVLGPGLVLLLYGADFAQAAVLTAWMSPLVLVVPASVICETYLSAHAALRIPIWGSIIGGALDLLLCLLLIPRWEANGAALANLAGQGLTGVLILAATVRRLPQIRLPVRRWALVMLFWFPLTAAAGYALIRVSGAWGWLAAAAILAVLGGAFGRFVGYLGPGESQWLQQTLPSPLVRFLPLVAGRRTASPSV